MTNSNHNKYVSIPDWFSQSNSQDVQQSTTTSSGTTSQGNDMIPPSASSKIKVNLYNKFVLAELELNKKILTVEDTAIIVNVENHELGEVIALTGWKSSDYLSVAANTTLEIKSSISQEYGIVFYTNSLNVIDGAVIDESPKQVTVPDGTSYFRISCESSYEDFSIIGYNRDSYEYEQILVSDQNAEHFTQLNEEIPEGISKITFSNSDLSLLVQSPLSLNSDEDNVIKLSLDYGKLKSDVDDMFVWDKKLAAFGYDKETGKAYTYIDEEQQFIVDENGETVPEMTDNPELWMYDENLEDKWIIKTTKQRFSLLEGLMEYDAEKDSFLFHKNIITSGGIVMYADLDDVNVPGLYDGLPIDNDTIFWNYDEEGNKLSLSAKTIKSIETTGEGNAITNVIVSKDNREITFVKEETFVTVDDIMDHIKTDDDTITVNQNGELEVLKGGVEIVSSLPSYYEPDILYILV